MPFDPDAGRTTDEIILWKWEHEWTAERKATIERIAAQRGSHWSDVVKECMEQLLDDLEDPVIRQRYEAKWERQEQPFGIDPRLRKDGEP